MQLWINNWAASLLQPLTAAATTAEVDPSAAARLTGLGSGDHYLLTLIGTDGVGNENAWEIVRVSAAAGGSLTIERAQEGTAARAWPAGTRLELRITAGVLSEIPRSPRTSARRLRVQHRCWRRWSSTCKPAWMRSSRPAPPPSTADGLISLVGIGKTQTRSMPTT